MEKPTMLTTPKLTLGALAVVLATGTAHAGPTPIPGTQHAPPRFVDEPSLGISLSRKEDGKIDGYVFNLSTRIAGATSKADRARLDWKQGGKLVATTKCALEIRGNDTGFVTCAYKDKPLTTKGAIEADLLYIDDADDTEYLLRTFKITVAKYPNAGIAVWQLVPDDLLGAAWVRHRYPQELNDLNDGRPHFYFWLANDSYLGDKLAMRCTVNGTKLPDIKFTAEPSDALAVEASTYTKTGDGIMYRWKQVDGCADVNFGLRSDYGPAANDYKGAFLGDHPGAWVCLVRHEGNGIRELAFTVNEKGFITSDLQTAKDAPMTFGNVSAVELRFPKGAKIDGRIRPDAMKKSRGFGLPWPDAPGDKTSQATFPAASGWPDPK
jgi:hypothetical protein